MSVFSGLLMWGEEETKCELPRAYPSIIDLCQASFSAATRAGEPSTSSAPRLPWTRSALHLAWKQRMQHETHSLHCGCTDAGPRRRLELQRLSQGLALWNLREAHAYCTSVSIVCRTIGSARECVPVNHAHALVSPPDLGCGPRHTPMRQVHSLVPQLLPPEYQ